VLGVWDGHDAGAALLDLTASGRIVCAVNEERFTRRKLEVGFPRHSIACCLDQAGLPPSAIDVVAVPTVDPAKTLTRVFPSLKERYYLLRRRKIPPGALSSLTRSAKYLLTLAPPNRLSRAISRLALRSALARCGLGSVSLRLVPHHGAHAASAAYTSGFEEALVLTLDGVGDGLAGSFSELRRGTLKLLSTISGRDSLGIFFEHVTRLLNMRELEDEGKVMALASYAQGPSGENPLESLFEVRPLGLRSRLGTLALRRHLARQLEMMPSEQFAYHAQSALEAKTVELISDAVRSTGFTRLAYAGGVAANVKVNLGLMERAGLDDIFIFPHMGDGGIALGAALWAAASHGVRTFDLGGLDLGPAVPEAAIAKALSDSGLPRRRSRCLEREVAARVAAGEVVLWFQGRMEYGPRALGQRSILARPDRPAIRHRLNQKLKRRVWYQPFCPSFLDEEAPRLLEDWNGRLDRFMTMAYRVSPEGRERLAGVLAEDGTCRPQMVGAAGGGRFRKLLEEVRAVTGVGALLNTSFNIHGEPLVATPEDALRAFVKSGAEALAMGEWIVENPTARKGEREKSPT
jgi:carbamoyltransferase